MKSFLAVAIAIASVSMAMPAHAMTGWDFYSQCGNAFTAGFANRGMCHGYITGFADAMSLDGQLCLRGANDVQAVMVVQNWLRMHPQNLSRPAPAMIRNALLSAWRCH